MSKRPVNLVLGFHNHQPVGNFDHVFDEALEHSYLPFLKVVENYPKMRFALHNSGCLWEWLEQHRTDYIDRIGPLVERGQIELLGGGFYEPILPSIPHRDRVAQLDMMRAYLDKRFGVQYRGIWLTERVWEQGLVRSLVEAGVEYLSVDDFHFGLVGIPAEKLHGYYLTEDEGQHVAVFPIDQKLRYLTPFHSIDEVRDYIERVRHAPAASEAGVVLPILDDGEKYGSWPGTHKWVYADGWLKKFCEFISDDSNGITAKLPGEIIDAMPAMGTVYLPDTSYQEMGIWALPPQIGKIIDTAMHEAEKEGRVDEARRLFNAAPWRNFLVKYPEAGQLHKRMLFVSNLVAEAEQEELPADSLAAAKRDLLRAQCNCAYWHGVFGGLYLPHLRRALYENLIAAETELFRAETEREITATTTADDGDGDEADPTAATAAAAGYFMTAVRDIDFDGRPELVMRAPGAAWWLHSRGGTMFGWDIRRNRINLLNSLARHPEMYHDAPVAEGSYGDSHGTIHEMKRLFTPKQKEALVYDWHSRFNGLDHFFATLSPANDHRLNRVRDEGDFIHGIFELSDEDDLESAEFAEGFFHDGTIHRGNTRYPVRLMKTYRFHADTGGFDYRVQITLGSDASGPLETWYAPEFNFALFTGNDPERRYRLGSQFLKLGETVDVQAPEIRVQSIPENLDITLSVNESAQPVAWRLYPVETVSQSERGFEMNLQSAAVLPHVQLQLKPGETASLTFVIDVAEYRGEA